MLPSIGFTRWHMNRLVLWPPQPDQGRCLEPCAPSRPRASAARITRSSLCGISLYPLGSSYGQGRCPLSPPASCLDFFFFCTIYLLFFLQRGVGLEIGESRVVAVQSVTIGRQSLMALYGGVSLFYLGGGGVSFRHKIGRQNEQCLGHCTHRDSMATSREKKLHARVTRRRRTWLFRRTRLEPGTRCPMWLLKER